MRYARHTRSAVALPGRLIQENVEDPGEGGTVVGVEAGEELLGLGAAGGPDGRRDPLAARGQSDQGGVASLTQRELQVARLIVDRRTNPEIADALFLSPKTVETHIRNIFRKLRVSSRVDVARAVERAASTGSTTSARDAGGSAKA